MADRRSPQAGGFFIALCILAGAVIGGLRGQPSIGLLVGAGVGILVAIGLWLTDQARRGR